MNEPELLNWLRERLAARLRVDAASIDVDVPLEKLGLDSMEAVELTAELEGALGRPVEPTALWDYATARALARGLATASAADPTAAMSDAEIEAELARRMGGES